MYGALWVCVQLIKMPLSARPPQGRDRSAQLSCNISQHTAKIERGNRGSPLAIIKQRDPAAKRRMHSGGVIANGTPEIGSPISGVMSTSANPASRPLIAPLQPRAEATEQPVTERS